MRTYLLLFLIMVVSIPRTMALSGGPDLFGYTWMDSNEPGGPVYNWIDIITSDKKVTGLSDDNFRGPFNMVSNGTNNFMFYWSQIDRFWVGSNGYISFGNILLASPFPNIPDPNDNRHNYVAGLLADLTFSGAGNPAECYFSDNWQHLIVSYINVPYYSQFYPYWAGSNTFQIILDKSDYSITIQFQSISGTTMNGDIRTGIENITGNIGLQPFSNTYPTAGYAIKYFYPQNPTYFVTDGASIWNTQPGSGGLFLPHPTTFDLNAKVANVGNLDIPPAYTATAKIRDFSGTQLLSTDVNFSDTLFVFGDSIFQYPQSFITPGANTYSYITRLSGIAGDIIQSNDSVVQELVVIDTAANAFSLTYTDQVPDYPGISWVDGTGGLGVYFVPPYYPVKIFNMRYYVESNPNGATFNAKLYDDDGPLGAPGTLLDSVLPGAIFVGGYNNVSPTHDIVLYDGGIYVGWEMFGTGITLARDITPPFSYRTYEFVGGIWSEYRSNQSEDFFITLNVTKHHIEDIGVPVIANMTNGMQIDTATVVSAWIKNFGQQPESNFTVSYQMKPRPAVTETYSGPAINPGDSILYTFSTPLYDTVDISNDLCVWTVKSNDYDRVNDTACVYIHILVTEPSALPETEPATLTAFPNPFGTHAEIQLPAGEGLYSLRAYDLYGRLVASEDGINSGSYTFFRNKLPAGMYILEFSGTHNYRVRLIAR